MDLQIYTKAEAQRILRVGTNKIGELLATGRIKAIKEGRRWLIPSEALQDFINGNIHELKKNKEENDGKQL